jgi:hypothetical protein
MNPFWASFFQHFRGCGRNAAWFLVTLGGMFVFLLFAAWAIDNGHGESLAMAVMVASFVGLVSLCITVRRAWIDRRHRLKLPKLSSDERGKARSKLVKPCQPLKLHQQAPPWIEG